MSGGASTRPRVGCQSCITARPVLKCCKNSVEQARSQTSRYVAVRLTSGLSCEQNCRDRCLLESWGCPDCKASTRQGAPPQVAASRPRCSRRRKPLWRRSPSRTFIQSCPSRTAALSVDRQRKLGASKFRLIRTASPLESFSHDVAHLRDRRLRRSSFCLLSLRQGRGRHSRNCKEV